MLATVGLMLGYVVFLEKGVSVTEICLVVGPALTGFYAIILVFCMRKGEDRGSRADDDGKLV